MQHSFMVHTQLTFPRSVRQLHQMNASAVLSKVVVLDSFREMDKPGLSALLVPEARRNGLMLWALYDQMMLRRATKSFLITPRLLGTLRWAEAARPRHTEYLIAHAFAMMRATFTSLRIASSNALNRDASPDIFPAFGVCFASVACQ